MSQESIPNSVKREAFISSSVPNIALEYRSQYFSTIEFSDNIPDDSSIQNDLSLCLQESDEDIEEFAKNIVKKSMIKSQPLSISTNLESRNPQESIHRKLGVKIGLSKMSTNKKGISKSFKSPTLFDYGFKNK